MRRLFLFLMLLVASFATAFAQEGRPNILWITNEDMGPHLAAYGDKYAVTPNLDKLATGGLRYTAAWSNAPVCAPARTTIISGLYPPSTGSENMRSMSRLPDGFKMYPQYLREAGYYCTNNSKEDYNLEKPGQVWDESSNKAHWRNRAEGQPFFAIFNFTITHESQIRTRPHQAKHDPKEAPLPAYHPDTPEVRQDWAQYYDNITEMDRQAGEILSQLQADGLVKDTIVLYYADHGSGMPRSKRWPYNSGLHVPMILHVPGKYSSLAPPEYFEGGNTDRLVSFVDLAPTVLSIAGIQPPAHFQGKAFLGKYIAPPNRYSFGFRGRMDERIDLVRTLRDKRFVYSRQYMPHRIYGQHVAYMFETPTTRVWRQLYDQGKLNAEQSKFWETKPAEELYDLRDDPWEVKNLADSPEYREILDRFRKELRRTLLEIRDVGFLPEGELAERAKGTTPWEFGHDPKQYPLEKILDMADAASILTGKRLPKLKAGLSDPESGVRYWAAMGLLIRGKDGVEQSQPALQQALHDKSAYVRVVAAEALGRYGSHAYSGRALDALVEMASLDHNPWQVSLAAISALQAMGDRARPAKDRIAQLPKEQKGLENRYGGYVPRALEHLVETLER